MSLINIFLEISEVRFSPVVVEITKVLFVSFLWIGGLTAFVYWKDKYKKIPVRN
jgi:hypothetical protein